MVLLFLVSDDESVRLCNVGDTLSRRRYFAGYHGISADFLQLEIMKKQVFEGSGIVSCFNDHIPVFGFLQNSWFFKAHDEEDGSYNLWENSHECAERIGNLSNNCAILEQGPWDMRILRLLAGEKRQTESSIICVAQGSCMETRRDITLFKGKPT